MGVQGRIFFGFCEVSNKCVFLIRFLGHRTVGNESQISLTFAANLIPMGSFGRGRRERRGAQEEKDEVLLRTVD